MDVLKWMSWNGCPEMGVLKFVQRNKCTEIYASVIVTENLAIFNTDESSFCLFCL